MSCRNGKNVFCYHGKQGHKGSASSLICNIEGDKDTRTISQGVKCNNSDKSAGHFAQGSHEDEKEKVTDSTKAT